MDLHLEEEEHFTGTVLEGTRLLCVHLLTLMERRRFVVVSFSSGETMTNAATIRRRLLNIMQVLFSHDA